MCMAQCKSGEGKPAMASTVIVIDIHGIVSRYRKDGSMIDLDHESRIKLFCCFYPRRLKYSVAQ
jgi:hypothetical protein